MRKIVLMILIMLVTMLVGANQVQADTEWLSGHHEINGGDTYSEIWMYNDATADMFGGEVYKLETYNTTDFDMLGGQMDLLYVHDNSTASIYAGSLQGLGIEESGSVDLYAYDVTYDPTGGHFDRGLLEGRYIANDLYFSFDLNHTGTFDHINIVPEPTTFLLVGLGGLFLRKRN